MKELDTLVDNYAKDLVEELLESITIQLKKHSHLKLSEKERKLIMQLLITKVCSKLISNNLVLMYG